MMQRLEVLVGVCVVGLALSVSTAVGIGGGSLTQGVWSNLPFLDSESTEASEPGSRVIPADAVGDETPDTAAAETADVQAPQGGAPAAAGCVEALTEHAQSRDQLEARVADADTPAGGASGNQNALDSQCGGDLAAPPSEDPTPTPDTAHTSPGKSEQAPPEPAPGGNANGQGQANADANGNGPAGAPGHNQPQ